jgi:hypothetical protein
MTNKQAAIILKIIAFISFIVGIIYSGMAIISILQNPVFDPKWAELLKEKIPNLIIQILIPNILRSLQFLLSGLLTGTTFTCVARYLLLIKEEKTV